MQELNKCCENKCEQEAIIFDSQGKGYCMFHAPLDLFSTQALKGIGKMQKGSIDLYRVVWRDSSGKVGELTNAYTHEAAILQMKMMQATYPERQYNLEFIRTIETGES